MFWCRPGVSLQPRPVPVRARDAVRFPAPGACAHFCLEEPANASDLGAALSLWSTGPGAVSQQPNACVVRFAEPPCEPCAPTSPSCKGTFSGSTITSLPGWLGSRQPSSITSAEAERAGFGFSADNTHLRLILLFAATHRLRQSKAGLTRRCCLMAGGLLASSCQRGAVRG